MKGRVKVSTAKLLEAVTKRRAKMVTDHERAVAAYGPKAEAYAQRVVAALRKAADDAEKGKVPETDYRGRIEVKVRGEEPSEPTLDTKRIDRLIATLEMAADESIVISSEDAAHYLG